MSSSKFEIDIRLATIAKIALAILAIYLLYLIKDIIALLLVVMIFFAIFAPVVDKWAKKIRRIPAVIAIILILVAIIAAASYLIFPPLISETSQFTINLPAYLDRFSYLKPYLPILQNNLGSIIKSFSISPSSFVSVTSNVFGGIITFITAIIIFIYMLLDPKVPENFAMSLIPSERRDGVKSMLIKISEKLSLWFRGQLLLSVIMGTFYLIALLIIGVPYALTIAIIAMLLEFIPIIGPIVSGTIAALIALTVSPLAAVIVIAVYLLGQWLENSIITPTIMKKVTGLSPIIVIVAILIGDRLLGPAGAILAVPISATISVAISEWPTIRKTLKTDD